MEGADIIELLSFRIVNRFDVAHGISNPCMYPSAVASIDHYYAVVSKTCAICSSLRQEQKSRLSLVRVGSVLPFTVFYAVIGSVFGGLLEFLEVFAGQLIESRPDVERPKHVAEKRLCAEHAPVKQCGTMRA